MSEKLLPEHIDPYRYAEQALRLSGEAKLTDMHRLESMIGSQEDKASVELHFGVDEQGISFLKGHLQTRLYLQCQRCLNPYHYEIIVDFVLGMVHTDDEAKQLPECYEPVLVKESHVALRELVEDEIILNLPLIPKHDSKDCKVAIPTDLEQAEDKIDNPFRVLESLKHKQD